VWTEPLEELATTQERRLWAETLAELGTMQERPV